MSKATKRKHVTREVIEEEVKPSGDQIIVKVSCGRGNNLHEVESCDGSKFLASMPTKFRKNVWIKRGDYVIVEPIAEGRKVQGEIVHILYPMQIKSLKQQGLWPEEFLEQSPSLPVPVNRQVQPDLQLEDSSESDNDGDLFENTNHPPEILLDSSDEST